MKAESNAPERLHFRYIKNTPKQRYAYVLLKYCAKIDLVFFFKTLSAGDEAGMVRVCFHIRNASCLYIKERFTTRLGFPRKLMPTREIQSNQKEY